MRELSISNSRNSPDLTDEGLRFLRPLIHLRSLELDSVSVSNKGLNYLDTLLELRVFTLSLNMLFTLRYNDVGMDDEFIAFRQWRRLEQFVLSLSGFKGVGSQLPFLSRCKNLKKLDLAYGENILSKNLSFLSSLKELEECHLAGCKSIDDSVPRYLEQCTRLVDLNLYGASIDDAAGVESIGVLKHLKKLSLAGSKMLSHPSHFAPLSKLTNLEELTLIFFSEHFNGQCLSVLRSCTHLKRLDLSCNKSLDVNELLTFGHVSVIRLSEVSFSSK